MTDSRPAKRILYVEGNVDGTIGGSYISLMFLASGLDRSRFVPLVVFSRENTLIPQFHERNVPTLVCPPIPTLRWQGFASRLLAKAINFMSAVVWQPLHLARLLRREQIALLHLNNSINLNHPWMIAAWFAGIPCITHERGINARFLRSGRLLARRLGAVICISKAVEDNFIARGLGSLPLVTIHNALEPGEMRVTRGATEIRAELGIAPHVRLIGFVGNIKRWKGPDILIRAMDRIRREFPDVVCLLVGDTPDSEADYRKEIQELIDRLALNDRIKITGFRNDVANYVNVLEIQVHASIAPEPFGRVLLEAMALCKPLVASKAGGVPEIVVDGATGLLFEPGDADGLADRLGQLLADPALARQLGQAGRARLETDFSIKRNVDRVQTLYSSLLTK